MSISTFNQSGSTQNPFAATGKGQIQVPVPQSFPTVTLATNTAVTLTASQSGVLFLLPSIGAVITLPAITTIAPGWNCKFQLTANNGTTAWTITSTGNVNGLLINNNGGALVGIIKTAANSAVIGTGAVLGDQVSVVCDGTRFSVTGYSGVNGGLA